MPLPQGFRVGEPDAALANKGRCARATQGWLGHRSITSTPVYTGAPIRFRDFSLD
jgi:hypothetical protein